MGNNFENDGSNRTVFNQPSGGSGAGIPSHVPSSGASANYPGSSTIVMGSFVSYPISSYYQDNASYQSQAQLGSMGQVGTHIRPCSCALCDPYKRNNIYNQQFATAIEPRILRDSRRGQTYTTGQELTETEKKQRRMYKDPQYFDDDGVCFNHDIDECDECEELAKKSKSLVAVAISKDRSVGAEESKKNFLQQTEFVQVALDLKDKELDDIKVSDLGKKVKEAQQTITVGKMKKYLKIDKNFPEKRGFVKSFIYWFQYWFTFKFFGGK